MIRKVKIVNIEPLIAVRPIATVAGYVGGKRALAKHIVPLIAARPHTLYCEPFLGMGGVFFRRPARPRVEAINDLSRDVATLFRVLQRHYQPFLDMLKWQIASRAEFERLAATDPDTLTDLERAARFIYLQKAGFGGKVISPVFGADMTGPARFSVDRLVPLLEAAHERLDGVFIECLPWHDFMTRWDRPHALFYVDPPYWGSEHYYGRGQFERREFELLAERLRSLQGDFVLSLNDVEPVRKLFAWAKFTPVGLNYSVGGKPSAARELIITRRRK